MTRTKKKSSSPEPSVVQAAWDAFYKESEVEDLKTLQAQGWKTLEQVACESGRARNTVDGAIKKSSHFERRSVRVKAVNGVRRMVIVRPKLKG